MLADAVLWLVITFFLLSPINVRRLHDRNMSCRLDGALGPNRDRCALFTNAPNKNSIFPLRTRPNFGIIEALG